MNMGDYAHAHALGVRAGPVMAPPQASPFNQQQRPPQMNGPQMNGPQQQPPLPYPPTQQQRLMQQNTNRVGVNVNMMNNMNPNAGVGGVGVNVGIGMGGVGMNVGPNRPMHNMSNNPAQTLHSQAQPPNNNPSSSNPNNPNNPSMSLSSLSMPSSAVSQSSQQPPAANLFNMPNMMGGPQQPGQPPSQGQPNQQNPNPALINMPFNMMNQGYGGPLNPMGHPMPGQMNTMPSSNTSSSSHLHPSQMPPPSNSNPHPLLSTPGDLPHTGAGPRFDLSDFPSLSDAHSHSHPASTNTGANPNATNAGANNSLASQLTSADFAIQNEDFPALSAATRSRAANSSAAGTTNRTVGSGSAPGSSGNLPTQNRPVGSAASSSIMSTLPSGSANPSNQTSSRPGSANTGSNSSSATTSPSSNPNNAGPKTQLTCDRYGLTGLLSVIRMTDPDLNTLALGTDLTTLGLNLNSSEVLYATFGSPCADVPTRLEPDYVLPYCYYMQPPALKTSHLSKFTLDTLFYIFYQMTKDTLQVYAAKELYKRDWRYHKELKLWFCRNTDKDNKNGSETQYMYFDVTTWEKKVYRDTHLLQPTQFMTEEELASI